MMDFRKALSGQQTILLDGATGTQLAAKGLEPGGARNLSHPDAVRAVHEAYVQAGSRVIITNTLTMNRIFLSAGGADAVDVGAVNRAGAEIARSAANRISGGGFVLGDISSTGHLLEPYGSLAEADAVECYREQASILASSGVDGFIIETMIDLKEALCALRACKEVSTLPVLVTMSFSVLKDGGRTVMGNSAQECAKALSGEGADAIGTNCGELDPFEVALVVAELRRHTPLPLIAQPNGGKPRLVDGKAVFDLSPDAFAQGIQKCIHNGAGLVGGCCGTGPAHIKAVASLLSS